MKRAGAAFAAIVLAVGGSSCQPAKRPALDPQRDIVVVAPHPDDETLIAGGILMAARAKGTAVAVIVVTNGDFTCERDGHVREAETVSALAGLGVAERDIHFLGYPDGWLAELGNEPLPPIARRMSDGSCASATGTYGERGADDHDEHRARTGLPGTYEARSLEEDLVSLLVRLRPRDLYTTHPMDTHPDHAATYAYVRRAIDRIGTAPRIHRAIVHAGACWPNGRETREPCPVIATHDLGSPLPPLPDPYANYAPGERIPVPDPARKLVAIGAYPSQLGSDPDHDWLTTFARADEPFWPETLRCAAQRCISSSTPAEEHALSAEMPEADVVPYHLKLEKAGENLAVTRGDRVLRRWTLPLAGRERPHMFAVTIAGVEGHATEVTIARDGALLGVAIDPFGEGP